MATKQQHFFNSKIAVKKKKKEKESIFGENSHMLPV
jgi:hypothetical protein